MDPFTLILLCGGALYLAARKATSPSSGTSGGQAALPSNTGTPTVANTNPLASIGQIGGAAGIVAGTAAAAVAAYQAGQSLDASINPNSNLASKTVAGVAGAVVVASVGAIALIAVLAGGLLATLGPIGAILIGVAVLTYAVFVGIQDLVRLQYGQAGARKDYASQLANFTKQCQDHVTIGAGANGAVVSQVEIDRQLVPFVEGWQTRLNWSAYQGWLQQKNVTVPGDVTVVLAAVGDTPGPAVKAGQNLPGTSVPLSSDLQWHVNFAVDRGYFVGDCDGMRSVGQDIGAFRNDALTSLQSDWVRAHCPPSEIVVGYAPSLASGSVQGQPTDASAPSILPVAVTGGSVGATVQNVRQSSGNLVTVYIWSGTWPTHDSTVETADTWTLALKNFGGPDKLQNQGCYRLYVPGLPQLTPGQSFLNSAQLAQQSAALKNVTLKPISVQLTYQQIPITWSDPRRPEFFNAGYLFGNFSIYKGCANGLTPKGDVKQLRAALAKRQFEGVINDDGSLTYSGATYHWNNPN